MKPPENVGRRNGDWGESVAVEHLRLRRYEILGRNVRPCAWDRRYEIDIVAWDRERDTIVFVEVKQHSRRSPYARRLQSVTRHKQELLRTACRTWLRQNRWQSSYRFDVIEIYGEPNSAARVEIDHIERVRLFVDESRFVDWAG